MLKPRALTVQVFARLELLVFLMESLWSACKRLSILRLNLALLMSPFMEFVQSMLRVALPGEISIQHFANR